MSPAIIQGFAIAQAANPAVQKRDPLGAKQKRELLAQLFKRTNVQFITADSDYAPGPTNSTRIISWSSWERMWQCHT